MVDILFSISLNTLLSWLYLLCLAIFVILIFKASQDSKTNFKWVQLISNPDGSASLTRVLQLTAGITGTWVILKLTIGSKLSTEMFAIYLAAMGISEGFSKWVQSKQQVNKND